MSVTGLLLELKGRERGRRSPSQRQDSTSGGFSHLRLEDVYFVVLACLLWVTGYVGDKLSARNVAYPSPVYSIRSSGTLRTVGDVVGSFNV